jgi:hypothetical protein
MVATVANEGGALPPRGGLEKKGGYDGTRDPGRPTNLMQPQRLPITPAGEQGQEAPTSHAGSGGGEAASGTGSNES